MLRFFRYLSYIFVTHKIIQLARGAIRPVRQSIQNQIKKAILSIAGSVLFFIGSIYILFHMAIEWDTLGYLTFNAQKSVCLTLMGVGLILIYPSRKVLREPKVNFFEMINKETANFIEKSTRPQNSQRTRPPVPEHNNV